MNTKEDELKQFGAIEAEGKLITRKVIAYKGLKPIGSSYLSFSFQQTYATL